jgi:hypothetical protein
MVMAKLLAGLASILAVLASVAGFPRILLVAGFPRIMPRDIYFHDVYFVVTAVRASGFMFLVALICGILSALYFAFSRWRLRPPNKLVGLVSFAITVVSLICLFVTAFLVRDDSQPHYSQLYALFGALSGFLLGFALLAANLAWALFSKGQSRFSSR